MMTIIFNFYDYDLWFNISRNIQGQEHAIEHLETSDTLPVSQTLGFLLGELTPRKDEDDLKFSKIAKKDEILALNENQVLRIQYRHFGRENTSKCLFKELMECLRLMKEL